MIKKTCDKLEEKLGGDWQDTLVELAEKICKEGYEMATDDKGGAFIKVAGVSITVNNANEPGDNTKDKCPIPETKEPEQKNPEDCEKTGKIGQLSGIKTTCERYIQFRCKSSDTAMITNGGEPAAVTTGTGDTGVVADGGEVATTASAEPSAQQVLG